MTGAGTRDRVERRLAAILAADVVGSSRLIEADEERALYAIQAVLSEDLIASAARHGGRLIKTIGDGALLEFASTVEAVTCAVEVQQAVADRAFAESEEHRVLLRVGVNVGDVVVGPDGDLFGDGVNVAARLEAIADPGGVCISSKVYDEIKGKLPLPFQDRGEQSLKNISRPVRVYALGGTPLRSTQGVHSEKPSIAVLPFTNMSKDEDQEILADGITEDMITELSRISSFLVIARNTVFTFKGKSIDVKEIGRALGVAYVLEGSLRRIGQRLRVTAQLIETNSGGHIWADKYDRELAEMFDLQDEIVRSVVASTQTQVVLHEGRNQVAGPPEFRVWELSKRGFADLYGLTRESLARAKQFGEEIVRLDASNARGHYLIANAVAHQLLLGHLESTPEAREETLREAEKAVQLDRRDEFGLWILGLILGIIHGRIEQAIAAYEQALQVNPNFSLAYGSLGTTLALAGRAEESIKHTLTAVRLNPRDPSIFFRYGALALAHFVNEDYVQARSWAEQTVARNDYWLGYAVLVASCWQLGDKDAARLAVSELRQRAPNLTTATFPVPTLKAAPVHQRFRDALVAAGLPKSP